MQGAESVAACPAGKRIIGGAATQAGAGHPEYAYADHEANVFRAKASEAINIAARAFCIDE